MWVISLIVRGSGKSIPAPVAGNPARERLEGSRRGIRADYRTSTLLEVKPGPAEGERGRTGAVVSLR